MVERIERLPPELQFIPFLDGPVLDDGQIRSADWRFLDHEFLGVSRSAVGVVRECGRIEIGIDPVTLSSLPHAKRLARNLVGAVLPNQKSGVIVALSPLTVKGGPDCAV